MTKAWDASADHGEIHRSVKWILAHVKRMSNGQGEDSAEYEDYYEEMEWRLVYDENRAGDYFKQVGDGVYRLPFKAQDVKVLVFPDEATKRLALQDRNVSDYFSPHAPIMPTLAACLDL